MKYIYVENWLNILYTQEEINPSFSFFFFDKIKKIQGKLKIHVFTPLPTHSKVNGLR